MNQLKYSIVIELNWLNRLPLVETISFQRLFKYNFKPNKLLKLRAYCKIS